MTLPSVSDFRGVYSQVSICLQSNGSTSFVDPQRGGWVGLGWGAEWKLRKMQQQLCRRVPSVLWRERWGVCAAWSQFISNISRPAAPLLNQLMFSWVLLQCIRERSRGVLGSCGCIVVQQLPKEDLSARNLSFCFFFSRLTFEYISIQDRLSYS